jgi:hypothetical protein
MTSWKDTVMSQTKKRVEVPSVLGGFASPVAGSVSIKGELEQQAQLSFEAGEQSRARLIADLQETVNRMLQDNSELVVKLEHERQEGRREVCMLVELRWPECKESLWWQEQKAKWFKETQHG